MTIGPRRVFRVACLLSLLAVQGMSLATMRLPAQEEPKAAQEEPKAAQATARSTSRPADEDTQYLELLKLLVDSLDQIDRNYVEPIDRRQLIESAVRGMLSELDPYSGYIGPKQIDRFRTGVDSEFGGVGIQVRQDDDQLRIISPIYGTPAYEAGLMAGDVIVEIAGQSAQGITIDDAVKMMKGKIGTTVSMKVQGPDDKQPRTVELRREIIRVQTVLGDRRRDDDTWEFMYDAESRIGLLRITTFGRHTADELRDALAALQKQGMRGLVLDLRNNPGGLLSAAIDVCDLFIAEGRIVSTEGRSSPKRTWDAHQEGTVDKFPLAVLVNHFSASASEIVSACLQDHERAVVVGERTWGKGSVQNIIELENGKSALKLTTAGYLRPSGANIHRRPNDDEDDQWGVRPDPGFEVALSEDEARAVEEARRQRELIRRRPATSNPTGGEPAADQPKPSGGAEPKAPETSDQPDARKIPDASDKPDASHKPDASDKPAAGDKPGDMPSVVDPQLEKALAYLRQKLQDP